MQTIKKWHKMPTKCPICNDPMMNEFIPAGFAYKVDYLKKSCSNKLNHKMIFQSRISGYNEVLKIGLHFVNMNRKIDWNFGKEEVTIYGGNSTLTIPYFDPDFSDIKKLYSKVKLYTTFS